MCLLAFISQVVPGYPLVVAANRDEFLARPADPMTTLQSDQPIIWGGRDLEAGGTWMACNEHGVVAGLTNQPGGLRAGARSRGELPLRLVGGTRRVTLECATSVAGALAEWPHLQASSYSGCWMFVGGRDGTSVLDLTQAASPVRSLDAGVHVLENRPFSPESPKASGTRAAIDAIDRDCSLGEYAERLRRVFASVEPASDHADPRPSELRARTVHLGVYGTRTFSVFAVPEAGPPEIFFTDGPPDTTTLVRLETAGLA